MCYETSVGVRRVRMWHNNKDNITKRLSCLTDRQSIYCHIQLLMKIYRTPISEINHGNSGMARFEISCHFIIQGGERREEDGKFVGVKADC